MEKSRSWPSAHDWKSCIPQKGIEGSNPSFSAKKQTPSDRMGFVFLREEGFEQLNAARTSAAADGLTEANLYFANQNANKSLLLRQKNDRFRPVVFLSIAKAMAYHHAARVYFITEGVYHQPQAAFSFRNDDIQFLRN